ncbi:MAG: hypothetical protein QME74_11705, partial [Candidatus Edwardsbacteria bacterium]|nr:hypothetical protein [Candidatus Edwardsbacteria bacterium]
DECGGLLFGSKSKENGEYDSELSLTFDQHKQDQIVQMLVSEKNGQRTYGFNIFDRPDYSIREYINKSQQIQKMEEGAKKHKALKELSENNQQRIFIGKDRNGDVSVCLNDRKGNARIRMIVDKDDAPRMEFLNGDGDIMYCLPPDKK